jgi:ATP-binding cassette subfamily B protein
MDFAKTKKAIDADINSWWHILKFESVYPPLFELVYAFAYFIAIGYGAYMVVTSTITPGNLVSFLVYVSMLYGPLINLSGILNSVNSITIADGRYHEIMEKVPEVRNEEQPLSVLEFKTIHFKNVSFKYPFDNFNVINNIDLTINSGETIGIVGPTGAGKSTLIRQLLREFNVTSGEILIDGKDIKHYKIEDVHDLVGYVPQDHVLFRRTVDDNILIGNPKASINEINEAMTIADFKKDLKDLPYGSSTMVSELGGSLSGGQRQRLSIARALVKNPEIYVFDDSFSALDFRTDAALRKALKDHTGDSTVIVVSQRVSTIMNAEQIVVLDDGKVVGCGTHRELLRSCPQYYDIASSQLSQEELA